MSAESDEEYGELENAVRRVHSIVESVYGNDLGRIMDCQNAIDACLKGCIGEGECDAEELQFALYVALKRSYPEVISRINQIVDDRRQNS